MSAEISICVPCFNRSRVPSSAGLLELFPKCVDSLVAAARASWIECELIVADYRSDDWPLADWLAERAWPIRAKVVTPHEKYTTGGGKNAAAELASAPVLFFCETDMLVPANLLVRGLVVTGRGDGYFPYYQRYRGPEHDAAYWGNGCGNAVVLRDDWLENKWIPSEGWGSGEDTLFSHWFWQRERLAREQLLEFYHQWHPFAPIKAALEAVGGEHNERIA